jgi:branched-chain amino acid transport system substrate-binding protein
MRHKAAAAAALAVLIVTGVACTSGDSTTGSTGTTTTAGGSGTTEVPTGPSPGVTDDTVKVGITYVDLDAVRQFVDLDQGDYEAAYQAVIDGINADGGINGRKIEPVFAKVSPLGTEPAEAVCTELTEDEDVFAVVGFFQDDAVLCPIGVHETAAIGGVMTKERFDQAAAPWFTTESGEDSDVDAVEAMAEAGQLDGKLGVYASILSESQLPAIEAKLDELGIEPVDSAVLDAPQDDITAQNQATGVIAERFKSKGIDKILVVGSAAVPIANGFAPLDYRTKLLFTSQVSVEAYTNGNDPDTSMFEGAVLGAIDNQLYAEDAMQDCLALVEDATGEKIPDPETIDPSDPNPFVSASAACRNISLFAAIAKAAGKDLNYGSFQSAGEGLGKVHLPGAETDYDYGPYPARDGDQAMYLWDWDPAEGRFARPDR